MASTASSDSAILSSSDEVVSLQPSERTKASSPETHGPNKLDCLVEMIIKSTASLNEYISQSACSQPSLDVSGASLKIPPSERDALSARSTLLDAIKQLQNLVKGPVGILMDIGANDILCLQVIQRYKIAEVLGIHEQLDFKTLSFRSGLNVKDLKRILRYAMTNSIFVEPQPGIIAHTAVSRILAEQPLIRDYVENVCEIRFKASAFTADAMQKYGLSQDSNQSGFSMSRNTARGVYDELQHYPEDSRRWSGAMSALAQQIDYEFILESFEWSSFQDATIVDVGGGRGDVSIGLAYRLPSAKFIVQDLATNVLTSGAKACSEDAQLDGRISYMHYDFREPQTAKCDVYYFRNIFHNWPDRMCINILRNQVPALKRGARLVIDDFTLHEPCTLPWTEERRRRWMDINMLVFFGSCERTVEEWRTLLFTADPRFHLVKVTVSQYYPSAILDIIWDTDMSVC